MDFGLAQGSFAAYDLQPGDYGVVRWWDDDGDMTSNYFLGPNPRFDAWFRDGNISAYSWPNGTHLTAEITNPSASPDLIWNGGADVTQNSSDPNDTAAEFRLNGAAVINPGYVITISGGGYTKAMVVADLSITSMDPVTDIITGKAGSKQPVWMHLDKGCAICGRDSRANASGDWEFNYSVPGPNGEPIVDITPGFKGAVNAQDIDGDNTSLLWSVSNPTFDVRANDDYVDAWDWPLHSTLTLNVYASGTESGAPDYTASTTVDGPLPWGDSRNHASFDLSGIYERWHHHQAHHSDRPGHRGNGYCHRYGQRDCAEQFQRDCNGLRQVRLLQPLCHCGWQRSLVGKLPCRWDPA